MECATPLNPAIVVRLEESFAAQGLMQHLGAEIASIRCGEVVLRMPFRAQLSQQHGFFHAGATTALADSAGGYAAFTLFAPGEDVLTTEFKLNLLNPARGEALEARGRVIKSGRTLSICQLDVWAEADGARTHVATGLQTLIRLGSAT